MRQILLGLTSPCEIWLFIYLFIENKILVSFIPSIIIKWKYLSTLFQIVDMDSQIVKLSEERLPFHPLMSKEPWKYICHELFLDNVQFWLSVFRLIGVSCFFYFHSSHREERVAGCKLYIVWVVLLFPILIIFISLLLHKPFLIAIYVVLSLYL